MKKLEDKLSGSYYTPFKTVQFMKKYLERVNKTYIKNGHRDSSSRYW